MKDEMKEVRHEMKEGFLEMNSNLFQQDNSGSK
jgi:hypothetical protein